MICCGSTRVGMACSPMSITITPSLVLSGSEPTALSYLAPDFLTKKYIQALPYLALDSLDWGKPIQGLSYFLLDSPDCENFIQALSYLALDFSA